MFQGSAYTLEDIHLDSIKKLHLDHTLLHTKAFMKLIKHDQFGYIKRERFRSR
ncbi:hypothetical protein Dsin_031940 [Dipteronia sinensis]|uniref:Uncharacterized protein n=1 Tax=Dipteronia sinensis TaxID=43782 RepID=A0AAE0DST9_9ROSI|nr:hypothetical protein Dsin_031940 [Dipteronia sinensis]